MAGGLRRRPQVHDVRARCHLARPDAGRDDRKWPPVRRVTLLTKADCSLCDQAKAILERVARDIPITVETVSLDSETGQTLAEQSRLLFPPGVLIDGEAFSWGRLSERRLRRALGC
ncbi:MAG: glutaredoxin family protein [Acidimicrobiales bacterium]